MLGMTAAVAVAIGALTRFPMVTSGVLCAIAFCYLVRFCIQNKQYCVPIVTLFACMCLPFVWIIVDDERHNFFPAILGIVSGLPAMLPASLIGVLLGQHPQDVTWLSVLLTGAELVVGAWMIRLGPRRAIAYLLFALWMSTLGSFGLNMLVRI
jgi:hypothetical protein